MKRLVIVESPTKAKTIRGFLPQGYHVEASMGHIRDLPESASEIPSAVKTKDWARLGVNVAADFEPLYVIPSKKRKVVKELKEALKDADELILATDEDREGESIGWHLVQVLRPQIPIRRMVFHEITKDAIQDALRHPRGIDEELVRAQETRRILDRLVGYKLSPLLWKKIAPGLSAGRVQSVAVRLLVNREEERRAFKSGIYWDLKATLSPVAVPKSKFEAQLMSIGGKRIATSKDFDPATGKVEPKKGIMLLSELDALALRDRLLRQPWLVTDVSERSQTRRPAPPFTTSTLQQEANRKLRLTSRQTMQVAQKLYEEGYITYMRTDSVNLSTEAITAARRTIEQRYGANYLSPQPRRYTTQSKNAQEAHEAIRPAGTQMRTADEIGLRGQEAALYDLVWKRTVATQMADAQLTLMTVEITVADAVFQANGKRIDFPGFFRAYVEGSDDPDIALEDREVQLPVLKVRDPLTCHQLDALKHETQPPVRYTEASLVQTLEKEGIGRPSTYATIISTVQDRGYVIKVANQLVPTFTAFAVNRLLESHFPDLVDTRFTARMEQSLDEIAEGKEQWLPYLQQFYLGQHGLETQVNDKEQSIDPRDIYALAIEEIDGRVRIGRYGPYLEVISPTADEEPVRVSLPDDLSPSDLVPETATRLLEQKTDGPQPLGYHPQTHEPIYLLSGRYGPYVQQGNTEANDGKPKRASLLRGMSTDTLTLETALALLSLPRTLGQHPQDGTFIEAAVGRYGPYIKHDQEFRSLTPQDDVLTVTLDRALYLLSQPKGGRKIGPIRELGQHPTDSQPVVLMNGRYGPYVKHGEVNATLPRSTNLDRLTLAEALPLLAAKANQPTRAKPARTRKATGTTTAAKAKPTAKTVSKKTVAKKLQTTRRPTAPKKSTRIANKSKK